MNPLLGCCALLLDMKHGNARARCVTRSSERPPTVTPLPSTPTPDQIERKILLNHFYSFLISSSTNPKSNYIASFPAFGSNSNCRLNIHSASFKNNFPYIIILITLIENSVANLKYFILDLVYLHLYIFVKNRG